MRSFHATFHRTTLPPSALFMPPQPAACTLPIPSQIVRRLVAEWPVTSRSIRFIQWHNSCEHMQNRADAVDRLLKLPAAEDFAPKDCVALAITAAKAGTSDAFMVLCRRLPQLPQACDEVPKALLLRMYQLAVDEGGPHYLCIYLCIYVVMYLFIYLCIYLFICYFFIIILNIMKFTSTLLHHYHNIIILFRYIIKFIITL